MIRYQMIILDIDGTMTDGKIYIDSNGIESKCFNVKDGMAISQAKSIGYNIVFFTARVSTIVEIRAKELGINDVYQGIKNKKDKLIEIAKANNVRLEEIVYIGDDLNDLEVMGLVGFCACPIDACIEIKEKSNFVSTYRGGDGAVREIIEFLLKKQGEWNKIVEKFKHINQ